MSLSLAGHVAAEPEKKAAETEKKSEISDRAVRLLMGMALSGMPAEMKTKDGKTVKIDKNKPDEILVPLEDGRRVIKVGRLSAYAEACKLPELQLANYKAFMFSEQKREKWSRLQLIYINRLHFFTLALMTGQLEAVPVEEEEGGAKKGDKKPATEKAEPTKYESKMEKLTCPPERKEQVRKQIETYVEEVKKSAS